MRHRIVPITFWASALMIVMVIVLPGSMSASGSSRGPADLEGIWDGFYNTPDGLTGFVSSDITEQKSRRLVGDGVLFDLPNGDLPYRFRGTVAGPDFVTGTGETPNGQFTFRGDLTTFEGRGGDAVVMESDFRFVPSRRGATRIGSLLLHPFPGVRSPDISGSAEGSFVSIPDPITGAFPDPSFMGTTRIQISPRNDRNSFAGNVQLFLDPNEPPTISWPLVASTSNDRRVVWISQGKTGRITYDGVVIPPRDDESDMFVGGFFTLRLNDGRNLFNAINFTFTR